MSYSNHFYNCGCWVRDIDYSSGVKIVFSKCKKHAKDFKLISWRQWAKNFAKSQYRKYELEHGRKVR